MYKMTPKQTNNQKSSFTFKRLFDMVPGVN